MTTTRDFELEKVARSRVRIKKYVDSDGDVVYKVQRKHWYGWATLYSYDLVFFYTTYRSYEAATKAAEEQIERELNRLKVKTKYFYYPF